MRIFMACPAPAGSRKGNRVTAVRWAGIIRALGHHLKIATDYDGSPCDVLVALHARRSYPAVAAYRKARPKGPLIVVLTGTDLYRDIRTSKRAQQSLVLADRLVLLQPRGADELTPALRRKARTIYQSARPVNLQPPSGDGHFEVVILGHLRAEKDPFRTVLALRLLSPEIPIRVTHLGEALSPAMATRARALMRAEPRYRWRGEVPRGQARRSLARSHLLVHTSRMEGGANVISEALADSVPVLASHIPGNVGLLGAKYPGYFPVADTAALAQLLHRAVCDERFYARLKESCVNLKPLVDPAREREAWRELLDELVGNTGKHR